MRACRCGVSGPTRPVGVARLQRDPCGRSHVPAPHWLLLCRLAPMRLYTLSKRHFVLVFVIFFVCFGLTVFVGIRGKVVFLVHPLQFPWRSAASLNPLGPGITWVLPPGPEFSLVAPGGLDQVGTLDGHFWRVFCASGSHLAPGMQSPWAGGEDRLCGQLQYSRFWGGSETGVSSGQDDCRGAGRGES